jgi:thiamine biosynthesis lipoprotein ApbE
VPSAFLHGGTSSAIGIGAPVGKSGWTVALESGPDARTAVLHNTAVSVSAAWQSNPHPTIDPRTGVAIPVPRRAAVIGPSARLADAWSTVLLVHGKRPDALGPEWDTWLSEPQIP